MLAKLLADGIDPTTGEVFPDDSPYQQPQTVRALFTLIRAVEANSKPPRPKDRPTKAGQPWTQEEGLRRTRLLNAF